MIRAAALLLVLAPAAGADRVAFVDGETAEARLESADRGAAVLRAGEDRREVPTRRLVEADFEGTAAPPTGPINLYLANGDRVRGTVGGKGDRVRLDGPGLEGLEVALERVRAVCYGRLMGAAQVRYAEVLAEELERGRDVVVVERGARPFVVAARVLAVEPEGLRVRVGDGARMLAFEKVYGFVRAVEGAAEPPALFVRLHLAGGERVTLPLERITANAVEGGGARVDRARIARIEFGGAHIAHLSDLQPIDAQSRVLFGEPPPWRRDGMVLGGPLRLRGATYARGLGVLAYTRLEYALGGRWKSLFVLCGIDDAAGREGAARFRVLGDGAVLAEVERRRGDEPVRLLLDTSGVDRLVLEALPGDSYTSDFCDWAEARLFGGGER